MAFRVRTLLGGFSNLAAGIHISDAHIQIPTILLAVINIIGITSVLMPMSKFKNTDYSTS
jgi:hypothetical protein